ncbi:hypothetical protein HanIR_Chr06g0294371 [Helianthus annuus]|nr:hypothetical protein HanIR_Chr06g0294371 [Helianthus annuus]
MLPGRLLFPPESSGVDTKHPMLYLIFLYICQPDINSDDSALHRYINPIHEKKKIENCVRLYLCS